MRRALLLGSLLLLAATPARTEVLNVGEATCADLGHHAARRFYAFWFDGYLAAKQGRTVSDGEKMEQRMERVAKACEGNPAQKLLPLMEKEK
jgi:hypothetical protein